MNGNEKQSVDGHSPGWGGSRPGSGKKPGIKRPAHTVNLPLRIKTIGQAIAKHQGYKSWGYAIEEALIRFAEELGVGIDI